MLGLLAVGATLPVLPRYVKGTLGGGDLEVGIVTGAFAVTGLAARPLAGRFADARGRKPAVLLGSGFTALAGALYFLPDLLPVGVPGLIVARLVLGLGEGTVYTAGAAWVVDLAPREMRGRLIGIYGLAIWGGLTLGPLIGELLLRASSFELVWAFAAGAPLIGALIAMRIPESFRPPAADARSEPAPLISRVALRPGLGLSLGIVGYATVAAFIVLHLDKEGIGHGATVFTLFAATVVITRLLGGGLPDRVGAARCAAGAGLVEACGLLAIAFTQSLGVALAGAIAMGAAFSLLFPSLALLVLDRVPVDRRGSAMGTFTAFFDLGVGVGSPIAGAAAALGGYPAAFSVAAACSVGTFAVAIALGRSRVAIPARAGA
jgi:MFS family permease